jgi:hypothetical protein
MRASCLHAVAVSPSGLASRACRRPRGRSSSRAHRVAPRAAGSADAADDDASFEGELLANIAASLDGKLRTLRVGVKDSRGSPARMNNRNATSGTLFRSPCWLDAYVDPGQHVVLVDRDTQKSVRKPISVSPYKARATVPDSDMSVIEILLDSDSDDGDENFFAAQMPPPSKGAPTYAVSAVRGGGFENPLFAEYTLRSALERGHALVVCAGGARGMGPARAVMESPEVLAHADTHPVTLFYLRAGEKASNGASAAYVGEWSEWREGGAGVVPCYGAFFDDGVFAVQSAIAGGAQGGGKHESVLGADAGKVTVLLAGLEREETEALLNVFANLRGVPREQILVLPGFGPKKK